ncbi:MAG: crossover junction endodeoxyribonuclease RuvC [Butyricicoccus sp.]
MIILGLDPGYGTTGYGVVKYDNVRFTPIQYGAIKTAPGQPFHLRLCEIYDDICTLVDTFHPDEVAMEELFFNNNITTGIQVAHARGVIMLALAQKGLHPVSYTPSQVKQSVVGYGKAEKRQVMEMTRSMLGLQKIPRPDDAADALAIAICHGHSSRSNLWEK